MEMNMQNKLKISFFLMAVALLLAGCTPHVRTIISAQYADRPVILGPCWKKGGKLDIVSKSAAGKNFESETENKKYVHSRYMGTIVQRYTKYDTGRTANLDNLSRDILMQNPEKNDIILVDEILIESSVYTTCLNGERYTSTGKVKGKIIAKPKRGLEDME
jgi:hypothetical protein